MAFPMVVGSEHKFEVQFTDLGSTVPGTFDWSSSDDLIATVVASNESDKRGVVTAVAAGDATITATDGSLSASFDIHVRAVATPHAHISPSPGI